MQPLTDSQRKAIHNLALSARGLLTREARDLLEGAYGLYPDGRMEPPDKLPQVQADPEVAETYRRLAQFLNDEERAGLPRAEAVEKLVKEVAFTHLNRLVAFKMMEARRLIRGTVDKGLDSNGFKFYLADPEHSADYALYQAGEDETAYRHFLLWQCGQIAAEVRVLFDPDTLPSRLFPRPRALRALLDLLNEPGLADVWSADETIGWIYQFFNEQEKAEVFERLYRQKQKIRRQDIPAATQLFTPHWIVRFLVQNTLGRLWVQMHPDTRLLGSDLLDYLAPLQGDLPTEPLRPVREITLLDPACGTMHFGLVAFDLFAAMHQEEMERAGQPGWPDTPSVSTAAEIPAAIISNNLFGIDIDLRAVQLSALALYLKAKGLNSKARITDSNLACADVLPLDGAKLGTFLREARFTRPVYERLMRALWTRLQDANQLGSLLRLEQELGDLIAEERAHYEKLPLFAGVKGEFERDAAEEEFWGIISAQIVQGLDEFARQQAQSGVDMTFFTGEAVKGLRLLDLMLRRHDIVVTNPPYSGKRNLNQTLAGYLDSDYRDTKGDLYAAFIQRCGEFTLEGGRVGMITQQSFMFLSSYEKLRGHLRSTFAIEAMAHTGSRAFAEIGGEKVNTTVFCLRAEPDTTARENSVGTYFRLVHAPNGEAKRQAFEQALQDGSNTYCVAERRFDAIPGNPWVYWISDSLRSLFERLPSLSEVAQPRQGLATANNFRFLRYWWEVGCKRIGFGCCDRVEALQTNQRWFPCMKGGSYQKWYGNQEHVVNWHAGGREIKTEIVHRYSYLNGKWEWVAKNTGFYFREGVTWSTLSSKGFNARLMPPGFVFETKGSAAFGRVDPLGLLAVTNSAVFSALFGFISPTMDFHEGYMAKVPIPAQPQEFVGSGAVVTRMAMRLEQILEKGLDFAMPAHWTDGLQRMTGTLRLMRDREREIDLLAYQLYGITDMDRRVIRAELAGKAISDEKEPERSARNANAGIEPEPPMTVEELGVRWISFAMGVVLGRFQPGSTGALGSAIYRRSDFAIGSLPEPDEGEFDQLVGPPERFAYVDTEGGRHTFPAEIESALRDLAVRDGITVLDEGHSRDLPVLVERGLALMLGETDAQEVIREAASGDLRKFLERGFFTKWHIKWYRKRPIYWPLQSGKRNYGFVLFHEKIDKATLYTLQREYLDPKLNGLRLHIGDLQGRLLNLSGAAGKRVEREIDKATKLLDELTEFAQTIDRIVREGYEPESDWIDDGVILRMAPLCELVPIWRREPKKYWERLQRGDYDWSHIAMRYWPERVREACKTNKSFAIAHGHEEWYEGS